MDAAYALVDFDNGGPRMLLELCMFAEASKNQASFFTFSLHSAVHAKCVCVCMCVMSLNIKLWVTNSRQKGSSFEQTCYQSSNHKISSILLLLCKIIGMNCGNVTSLETVTMSLNL